MINKFLSGKKKYSVFITTLLVAALEMFVTDPEAQKELMDFIPMLAMMLSGITYLVVEGIRDIQREKNQARLSPGMPAAAPDAAAAPPQFPHNTQPSPQPQNPQNSPPQPVVWQPLDMSDIEARVEHLARDHYLESNEFTRLYAAESVGRHIPCVHIDQALQYWDYLVSLAHKAFEAKFGFPYQEADKHLADDKSCPYYSIDNMARQRGIDFWRMLLDLRRILRNAEALNKVAANDFQWQAVVPQQYHNVYSLGSCAPGIVETYNM